MENKLDLNQFASPHNHQLSITPRKETAELEAELRIKEADALHQRKKELVLLQVTSAAVLALIVACLWIVITKGLSAEDGKWASGALTAIVSALVGYFTGKTSK
jgi:hypothetical protein